MAKAKVVHSQDSCMIVFKGNPKSPEPSSGVIKFPGGEVEVSRTSEGKYWAHIKINDNAQVTRSRIDYEHDAYQACIAEGHPTIPDIPHGNEVEHLAIEIDGPYQSTETL